MVLYALFSRTGKKKKIAGMSDQLLILFPVYAYPIR